MTVHKQQDTETSMTGKCQLQLTEMEITKDIQTWN